MNKHRNFEPEDLDKLQSAASWLNRLADRDCYDSHRPDDPCDVCQARHALELVQKVLDPKLEGLYPNRIKNHAERLYVERFRAECESKPGVNGGFGLLELILQPEGSKTVPHVSQRDATVAASVIQWLGTNCGRAFIDAVERLIKVEQRERQDFGVHYPGSCGTQEAQSEILDDGKLHQVAMSVARDYFSMDRQSSVMRCLANAIVNVAVQWHRKQLKDLLAEKTSQETA
jgi:hypothetical protein